MLKHRLIAFTALGLALFGLGGCKGKPLPPEGEVISLSLGGGHMTRDSFYNYYLREKDGQVLLDTHYWVVSGDDYREIILENAEAAQEDLDALRALCDEYHFAQRQKDYRKGPFIADAPMLGLEAVWENGARLDADTSFGSEQALRAFFEALATRME